MENQSQTTPMNGDYLDWLTQVFAGFIDELELSDFRTRLLNSRWLGQIIWMKPQ